MNSTNALRRRGLDALVAMLAVSAASACTYDFNGFEGLGAPEPDAGADGRGGASTTVDASAEGAGRGGSGAGDSGATGSGGAAGTGASTGGNGGTSGGSGGATGGSGGATGGSGGAAGNAGGSGGSGAKAGASGSAGSAGSMGSGGMAGATGQGGASGAGGNGAAGGQITDASTDGSGGGSGAGGSTGGAAGTAGSSGTSNADAAPDVTPPLDATTDENDAPPDATFDCDAVGGTVYQGHCYYAVSVAVDWNTANTTTCQAPAHLVTITSAGEQAVVETLLSNQDRWIGMRRPANSPQVESSFYWITNEAISYRNWDTYSDADKEPNYTGDCVRIRFTNKWADDACTNAYAVICEHE